MTQQNIIIGLLLVSLFCFLLVWFELKHVSGSAKPTKNPTKKATPSKKKK